MAEKDRIKPYLESLVKGYVFDELSEEFLKRLKADDILAGVHVPMDAVKFAGFASGRSDIRGIDIAKACGMVLGAAPDFPYAEVYKQFLIRVFGGAAKALEALEIEGSGLMSKGMEMSSKRDDDPHASEGTFMRAACYFRAALEIDPASQNALYGYGLCCRELYMSSEDDNRTGDFKAEFITVMEKLTVYHPKFAFPYYFLGYVYLNMGQYIKAQLAWNTFLDNIKDDPAREEAFDEINEVKERLGTLDDPVRIEQGVLAIEGGRYMQAIEILEDYLEGDYANWWPLHYYLGVGYAAMGEADASIQSFKYALTLSPSNVDVMDELRIVYEIIGDEVNAKKYAEKIALVEANRKLDRQ